MVVFYFTSTARYIKVFELVMVELRRTKPRAKCPGSKCPTTHSSLRTPCCRLNRISCLYIEFGTGIMNEVCSRKRNQEATITDANH